MGSLSVKDKRPFLSTVRSPYIGSLHLRSSLLPSFFFFNYFLSQGLTLLPRLEYSGMIIAHYNLQLLGSNDPFASASQETRTIGMCHQARLIVLSFVAQASLELLASSDPDSAFQSAGITGMNNHTQPLLLISIYSHSS